MKYYTLKEASEIMKVCIQTLRRYIASGKLKASKIGKAYLLDEEDIKSFIASQKV